MAANSLRAASLLLSRVGDVSFLKPQSRLDEKELVWAWERSADGPELEKQHDYRQHKKSSAGTFLQGKIRRKRLTTIIADR